MPFEEKFGNLLIGFLIPVPSPAKFVPVARIAAVAGKWGTRGAEAAEGAGKAVGAACSFSGETLVEMGDGSSKPISQVKVGDEVLATDPETGERGPRKVTHLWVHTDTLLELEVDGGVLTTTEDHPFWNVTDGEFQRANHLDRGDRLLTPDGRTVLVKGIRHGSNKVATAYNLTVDDIHTYYVFAGSTPILVHNSNGCGTGTVWDAIKATQPNYAGSVLPRSFELTAGGARVWVHGNASEHMAEYLSGMAAARRNESANRYGYSGPAIQPASRSG